MANCECSSFTGKRLAILSNGNRMQRILFTFANVKMYINLRKFVILNNVSWRLVVQTTHRKRIPECEMHVQMGGQVLEMRALHQLNIQCVCTSACRSHLSDSVYASNSFGAHMVIQRSEHQNIYYSMCLKRCFLSLIHKLLRQTN